MKKNYNYTRCKLFLPEYGRHIHEMVASLLEVEDRRERTRQAKAVIAVMGNLNPLLRDTADFTHKLWDHLFIMSDFQLDVDSPYPRPSRQDLTVAQRRMPYSRYMRAKSYEYNQEHPNNEVIIKDIRQMSGGNISIDEAAINNLRSDYKQHFTAHPQKGPQRTGGRPVQKGRNNPRARQGNYQQNHQGQHQGYVKNGRSYNSTK